MEFVYVVKRYDLFDLHFPHGFVPGDDDPDGMKGYLAQARGKGFFMERRFAETDSSFKQIIPYTLVIRARQEVLLLRRSKMGGDARLHDKLSIGVGGHINPPDAEHDDLIQACARREIDEEIELDQQAEPVPIGVLNDDSNAVGSVHFGIVHAMHIEGGEVRVRETELLEASFVHVDALKEQAADESVNMETWSRLIATRIDELLARDSG